MSVEYNGTMPRFLIPYEDLQQGGMFSFMRNFRRYLEGRDVEVVDRLDREADVLLANSWASTYRDILAAKKRHPRMRVLHRIDGSAADYGRDPLADRHQELLNHLADVTIYQSEYGRRMTHVERSIIHQDGPVVHNPVDVERFRPDGETVPLAGRHRIAHVTFSTNSRKGAADLYRVALAHPDLDFHLVGKYENPPLAPNIHLAGHLTWDHLPAVLRSCHYMVIFSEKETCPNVVLEAMASGLPVLYKDSGGIAELVEKTGAAVTTETFAAVFREIAPRRDELARAARERAVARFNPDLIFSRYLEAGFQATRRALPGLFRQLLHRIRWRLAR